MDLSDHETRLRRLEDGREAAIGTLARVETKLAELDRLPAKLDALTQAVQSLQITLAAHRECPAPGECLKLRGELDAIIKRIAAIEIERHKLAGMFIVIGAVASVVIGPLVKWVMTLFRP